MNLKIKIVSAISIVIVIVVVIAIIVPKEETIDDEQIEISQNTANVIMPTKVSRPGCEETNSCYIPSKITTKQGESITWINEDAAFHSVTSGTYDAPTGLFDSGHLDPYQTFSYTFDKTGVYDYYCTLHPWMEGKIIVE